MLRRAAVKHRGREAGDEDEKDDEQRRAPAPAPPAPRRGARLLLRGQELLVVVRRAHRVWTPTRRARTRGRH
eukprot:29465-Pelagococcus_subviridis.AAC.3